MNDLQIFKNDQFGEIRTVEENGTVLFSSTVRTSQRRSGM